MAGIRRTVLLIQENYQITPDFWCIENNIANGTKGKGQALPSGLPPRGGQTACPPHPLGNFYGLILGIIYCATRGDAELERDRKRFE